MKTLLNILIVLCCLKVTVIAQTSMLDLRKKVKNAKVQRTQTYVQAVDDALAQNDLPAAERALTAAIAQGTLTQNQINDTRAAIQSRSATISDQRLAQEQAKRQQEQAVAANNQPTPTRPSGGTPAAGKFHSVNIAFGSNGYWYQTARVFNVDGSGKEIGFPVPASPGTCNGNLKLASDDNTPYHHCSISGDFTPGTYGYEASLNRVDQDPLGLMGGSKVLGRVGPISGTFTIPQGCTKVSLLWQPSDKKFEILYLK